MAEQIMSMALSSGLWAALFCFLFLYMLKDARSRESRYTQTIQTLGEQLGNATNALKICEGIKADGETALQTGYEIKGNTEQIKDDVEAIRELL